MADATTLQFGQINGAGARDALFLKVYGGEVLSAFEINCVTLDKHMVRTIASGKSAQFPATWRVAASYHTPGAEIVGQTSNVNERVIVIDDLLIAPVFLATLDEAKSHYDVRSIYSKEAGLALAYAWDANVLRKGIQAARASATITGGTGGSVLTNAAYGTDGQALVSGAFAAAQVLDEKNIPDMGDRNFFMRPAQYYLVAQTTNVLNKDWGGQGSYADGTAVKASNVTFVKTNQLPNTNVTTGPTSYQGNYSTTVGVVMNPKAVGTVKLMNLATEMAWDIRRQGTLIVSKYAIGTDILRPECAVELKTA